MLLLFASMACSSPLNHILSIEAWKGWEGATGHHAARNTVLGVCVKISLVGL